MGDQRAAPGSHRRAALLLLVHLTLLLMATPGLDQLGASTLATRKEVARVEAVGVPSSLVAVGVFIADANRRVRLPVVRRLTALQRPLRIEQSWGLYGNGASAVRRMEVWVDGVLRHRSADPDFDWLDAQLRSRRIRPVVDTVSRDRSVRNRHGLMRLVVHHAEREFAAQEVELRFTQAPFPKGPVGTEHAAAAGSPGARTVGRLVARAPDWAVEPAP